MNDSIYDVLEKANEKQLKGAGVERGVDYKRVRGNCVRVLELLHIRIVVVIT